MRTRFAPSPTGFLHVGGLRTALYACLIARQSKGKFILRIEDTDQERSVTGAIENILRTLHWAGLDPDEGVVLDQGEISEKGTYRPYIQSQRIDIYKKYANELLKKGSAYRCFCSSERLEQMRLDQQKRKEAPMYDRLCLALSEDDAREKAEKGKPYVIRLKIPRDETITFSDDIRGNLSFMGHTVDDQILIKSDGFPTYHLAHVVDDHLMDINIVIRGEEWLSSLPKHLILFQELGWKPPRFAHVPLLLNKDRTKLSKRESAVSAEDYINKGYLPEAIINFIALLGWNPGTEEEIFSMDKLIENFSIDRVQKSGAIFDTEKLDWLQGQWIRKISINEFADRIRPLVAEKFPQAARDPDFKKRAVLVQNRLTLLPEATGMMSYFYEEPKVSKELLINDKQKVTPKILPEIMKALIDALERVDEKDWNEENLKEALFKLAEDRKWKNGQVLWPLRTALTGLPYSPGAFEVSAALGKEEALKRLEAVI